MPHLIASFVGGLGLLLFGMSLMTDGLKLATGNALRDMLGNWTRTRWRGLCAGTLVTALLQSSGAVTVATIGFANAGMLSLERAIWVIYGSNVGSTMTGWIVALLGFKLDIEALALPLVGLGALLKFTGSRTKRAAAGVALIGFGLLFLGIAFLKDAFVSLEQYVALPDLSSATWLQLPLYALLGAILATLMQSSTATFVLTLGALQAGWLPLGAAGAIVIGANVGTTSTGMLSVIGATANAKRVAFSHVVFNVASGVVGLLLIPPMQWLVARYEGGMITELEPVLALFNTAFNVFGVLLMWPLTDALVRDLRRRFSNAEELASRPQHLDRATLQMPDIATDAVALEVSRINHHTIAAFEISLHFHERRLPSFEEHRIVRSLAAAVAEFTVEIGRAELTPMLSSTLASLMESTQQYLLVIDIIEDLALTDIGTRETLHAEVTTALEDYFACIHRHLDAQDLRKPETLQRGMESYDEVELYYRILKEAILRSATRGELTMERVDLLLQFVNQAKRGCRQLAKATQRLLLVHDWLRHTPQF